MATNKTGKGTANVAVNLLDEERDILCRLAIADDRSLGDEIRRLAVAGLWVSHPELAQAMQEARRNHREQTLLHLNP